MLAVGLIMVIVAAILLIANFSGDGTGPIVLGAVGIVFTGVSRARHRL